MTIETRDFIQFAICATTTVLLIALLIFHSIKSFKAFHDINSELSWTWNSVVCYSILLICIGLLYCSFVIFEETYLFIYGSFGMAICSILIASFVTIYGVFKLIMYYALITRLTESFKDASTFYTCSNKFYFYWKLFVLITVIPFIIISNMLIKVDNDEIKFGKCRASIPIYNTAAIVVYDIFLCVINLCLFIIPLNKLSQELDSSESTNQTSSFYRLLIKKNAILATITISTSVLTWIMIGLFRDILHIPVTWQSIDCLISSICIVLLFKWNQILFHVLCCGECCTDKQPETLEMIHAHNTDSKTKNVVIATPTNDTETIEIPDIATTTTPNSIDIQFDNNSQSETEVP